MKNKLFYLTKTSLNRKIKSKWFLIVNILLIVCIIGLINMDNLINMFGGDFNKTTKIYVLNNTNIDTTDDLLIKYIDDTNKQFGDLENIDTVISSDSVNKLKNEIKDTENIVIEINNSDTNYISATVISNKSMGTILNQILNTSLNTMKTNIALELSDIDTELLLKINSPIVIDNIYLNDELNSKENMDIIMSTIFPIIILPFFMLTVFLIQMIGGEINDEKNTKSMEIIISNVSPVTHLTSKVLAGNLFVFMQALIFVFASLIGLIIRNLVGGNALFDMNFLGNNDIATSFITPEIISKITTIIPITILLMILSFVAYSILAGVLASMSTNAEDYQQIQSPIIIISVIGYYLAIMAGLFEGSIFIKVMSYIPFISCLLSPCLLLLGQIGVVDILISVGLLGLTIFFLIKYGLKIYKVGILNYSSSKLFRKMFRAVKK